MTATKLFAFAALIYLSGCNAGPKASFAPASAPPPTQTGALPSSVTADQFTWEVTAGAAPQTFVLTQTVQTAGAGQNTAAQTPPTDEQVKKAAEQALPPGCKIEEIKTSNGESQVKFTC